jgi:hypothetical protein
MTLVCRRGGGIVGILVHRHARAIITSSYSRACDSGRNMRAPRVEMPVLYVASCVYSARRQIAMVSLRRQLTLELDLLQTRVRSIGIRSQVNEFVGRSAPRLRTRQLRRSETPGWLCLVLGGIRVNDADVFLSAEARGSVRFLRAISSLKAW